MMNTRKRQDIFRTITENAGALSKNDRVPELVAQAIRLNEAEFSDDGALIVDTGQHTGRSAGDRFIVADAVTRNSVWWDNAKSTTTDNFERLLGDMLAATGQRNLFLQQLHAGADNQQRFNVDIFTENAWHALFIRNLLIQPAGGTPDSFEADATILHMPGFKADPERHGTRNETAIMLDFSRNIILICGTAYAGEIKKSVFTLFGFHAPRSGVLPMHCSANIGKAGDTALFFGLSGTGKTTLSADPERAMIGDDEHGWSANGIFNLEGGCYAKTIKLCPDAEPDLFKAAGKFGTVLENVLLDRESLKPDFNDDTRTENTRAAFPLTALTNFRRGGTGPAPRTIILLTADAFGVLPPVARLTPDQAIYHFLSGYTAKVAGTERGVTEPEATFSACFGAQFMALHPSVYGNMLKRLLHEHQAQCWFVNTGWTGGPYGVGKRISIQTTRTLVSRALSGTLEKAPMSIDPVFGFEVPIAVSGVDATLLRPRATWNDPDAYDAQVKKLVALFDENFRKFGDRSAGIARAGPRLVNAA